MQKKKLIIFKYYKYGCWWEDATGDSSWQDLKQSTYNEPTICYTEGYLIARNVDYHTFVMSFQRDEIGDQMVIPTKAIKKLQQLGAKTFTQEEFCYGTYSKRKKTS